ncbi:MAG: SpoIIE family protein phosphatase [Oligoflexia bacterium]|nr:SpoIIE family protein phosphatase [Oligoflexia bacterium]
MRLTIGRKLNSLIALTLLVSVLGVVWTATDVFTSDLGRLLRKGALDTAMLLSGRVRAELGNLAERAGTLGMVSLEDFRHPEDRLALLERLLARDPDLLAVTLFRMVDASPVADWRVARTAAKEKARGSPGLDQTELERLQREFPLDLQAVSRGEVRFAVASLRDGAPALRMGVPFIQRTGGAFSELLVLEFLPRKLNSLFEETTEFAGCLVTRAGLVLASSDPRVCEIGRSLAALPILSRPERSSGLPLQSDFIALDGSRQLGALHPIGFAGLAVLTQAPFGAIERARRALYLRAGLLGLIALSSALLLSLRLAGTITRPIQELSAAAARVSTGDLSARVPQRSVAPGRGDEVTVLSSVFNQMAGRIGELLVETAEKARMEKELETAEAVQSHFFPTRELRVGRLALAGKCLSAFECGGDWWQHALVHGRIIMAMGDVTGHGVSAALVTAAAHAAFSLGIRRIQEGAPDVASEQWLETLLAGMNHAVLAAANGTCSMTLIASVIDPASGRIVSMNASHRWPYVLRGGAAAEGSSRRPVETLVQSTGSPLGEGPELRLPAETFELRPGDAILWYTDGLVELKNQSGHTVSKVKLMTALESLQASYQACPEAITSGLLEFLGRLSQTGSQGLPDDVTVVVGLMARTDSQSISTS